jgi:hypothetical protein
MTGAYQEIPIIRRPRQGRVISGPRAIALLGASLVPVAFGAVLLVSAIVGRPLLAKSVVTRSRASDFSDHWRLTVLWGVGLLVLGVAQFAGAAEGVMSITNPIGLVTRTLFALASELLLIVATMAYLRRRRV